MLLEVLPLERDVITKKSSPIMSLLEMYVTSVHRQFSLNYLIPLSQVGSMPKGDIDVGTGLVGAPAYVVFFDFIDILNPTHNR